MFTEPHAHEDDKKVWLGTSEIDTLLGMPDDENKRLAYSLGVRCGLRSEEVTNVHPDNLVETEAGMFLLVPDGKGDQYRETPIPNSLANTIRAAARFRTEPATHPIVTSESASPGVSTRTLRRWLETTRSTLAEQSGDDRWQHLSFHDLRRTWATQLKGADVDSLLVCDWGGWDDLDTFLNHYRGTYAPDVQADERAKVGWL
jgi:integrase